ncbi:MAG TPA: glycosyltransferase family 39 protein [Stenotrophobium sp.]|nr:glycosyltransferase family 39 protein [Stenotrophobium sp.]
MNPYRSSDLWERRLRWALGTALLLRLLFPFFDSPLTHLFSDPGRHWQNGLNFLHPDIMGSGDPFLYQLWIFLLQKIAHGNPAAIVTGCGALCALMPYGWYRALKELLPKNRALAGALLIALVPDCLGIYAYFMNETLLLTLTGFAFWATFRAQRKRSVAAFALACALWLAAGFTRSVALPIALLCLLALWLPQPQKIAKAVIGSILLLGLLIPAGLHGRSTLGYFAPFGNLYLNEIYSQSGQRTISLNFGPQGRYYFGSPSFYNPTFYPFSDWTTHRTGDAAVKIDLAKGRADWIAELQRMRQLRTFSRPREIGENLLYLLFGQSWPDNDRGSISGWLTVWTRWLWPLVILAVAAGAARRRFRGREWLLPACSLGLLLYLAVQQQGVMEARFRKPIDPILVAAAVVMLHRRTRHPPGPDAGTPA